MEDLSLHILDLVENSLSAGAKNVTVTVIEKRKEDQLVIILEDDGRGMTPEEVKRATDPFFTSRTTRKIGLGLSLFDEAVRAANGTMLIRSEIGHGTKVEATFQRSHIDRKPFGNMSETVRMLIVGSPDVEFRFIHECDGRRSELDTRMVRSALGEMEPHSPPALALVNKYIVDYGASFSEGE